MNQRHRGAVVAIAVALAVVVITSILAVQRPVSAFEHRVFRGVNELPDGLHPFFFTVQQVGAFLAVVVFALGALVLRRPRLAAAFAIAGTASWLAARVVKALVDRPRPFELFVATVVHGRPAEGLGFPSGHSAVSAALATVVAPYLPRWGRVAVYGVVVLVGLARMYVGAHLPLDIVGGWALGFAVGTATNVCLGPQRR